jgi:hypothetical protein
MCYCLQSANVLWPKQGLKRYPKLQAAAKRLEENVKGMHDVVATIPDFDVPLKTLAQAVRVREISYRDCTDDVLLVFTTDIGETTASIPRRRVRILRAVYNAIHITDLLQEGFVHSSDKIGKEKNAFLKNAIWSSLAEKYWNTFCDDVQLILDYSENICTKRKEGTTSS